MPDAPVPAGPTSDALGRLPRPPFHPHVQAVMEAVRLPSITPGLIGNLREANAEDPEELERRGFERTEHPVPAHGGGTNRLTTWRPRGAGVGPGYLFIHGGGMVSGNRFAAGDMVPPLLEEGGVLASIEYRLAPEHPAPVPVEDCHLAVSWALEHADELGFDPDRTLLAGTSAGGGLAAGVLLRLRDRGGPRLAGGWLNCPMLDDRSDSVSAQQFHRLGLFWDGVSNRTGWQALLGEACGTDAVRVYDAPARADWLGGLPPLLVTVGSAEVFRDEDVAFASAVWRDGGDCQLMVVPGGTHSYVGAAPDSDIAAVHQEVVQRWIASRLDPDQPDGARAAIKQLRPLEDCYPPQLP